jgi:hypothetical protein
MKEIRLCWSSMVSHLKHEIQPTANWQPRSNDLRLDYEIIARAGNEVYGPETHWIEERERLPIGCHASSEAAPAFFLLPRYPANA